jgi:hypothetical protein
MQVNPASQHAVEAPQATQATQTPQSDAKAVAKQVAQQLVPQADTVVLSEKAKDLAAQQAGKSASEEAHESLTAKEKEAQNQVTK